MIARAAPARAVVGRGRATTGHRAPIQVLDAGGVLVCPLPEGVGAAQLRTLYAAMVRARAVDRQAILLQRQGELGVYCSCRGQEAAQVGSAAALADGDWAFPQGRELAAAMVRGLDPVDWLHVWRGTWHGHHDPRALRFGPLSVPIGTQVPHAVGVAMAARLDGSDAVVLAYFGDGATSTGDVHEAMNFAAVYAAPCVFFVQNNQWAISVPLDRQTRARTLADKATGYGMPGVRCDGNDVLACLAVTRDAVARARGGGGPTLIEAVTYRMEAHTTADDATRYRDDAETAAWSARDPIARLRVLMERDHGWSEADEQLLAADAARECARVRAAIVAAPSPPPDTLFEHVYVTPTPALVEQRAALRRRGRGEGR